MGALVLFLLQWLNDRRLEIRFTITLFFIDLLLLAAVETWLVHRHHLLFDPWVIAVGLVWIITTAALIWFLGGLVLDAFLIFRLAGAEPGQVFTAGLNIAFVAQATVVVFFTLVPVWYCWPAFLLLLVALVGLMTSTSLAPAVSPNWNKVYRFYRLLVTGLLVAIVVFALFTEIFSARWSHWNDWSGWREWFRQGARNARLPSEVELHGAKSAARDWHSTFGRLVPNAGVLLLAALLFLASYVLRSLKKSLRGVAAVLVLLWGIWLVDGVGTVSRMLGIRVPTWTTCAPTRQAVIVQPPPQKRRTETVRLQPDVWSREIYPPAETRHVRFSGPVDGKVLTSNGTKGSIHEEYGSRMKGSRWIKFLSSTGGMVELTYIF